MPARDAAGMMLPLLLVMDVIAVWTYRKDVDWRILKIMLPGATVGTLIGWALWSLRLRRHGAAVRRRRHAAVHPRCHPAAAQEARGPAAIKAVGHVLGRLCRLHQLHQPHRRPAVPDLRAAAAADAGQSIPAPRRSSSPSSTPPSWSPTSSSASSTCQPDASPPILAPVAIVGVLIGVWLVRRISMKLFYQLAYWLVFLLALKLIYDGVVGRVLRRRRGLTEAMNDYRLDHIALLVRDLDETRALSTPTCSASAKCPTRWAARISAGSSSATASASTSRPATFSGTHVEKRDALRASQPPISMPPWRISARAGAEFSDMKGTLGAVNVRPDGMRAVFLQDPNGYWFEINDFGSRRQNEKGRGECRGLRNSHGIRWSPQARRLTACVPVRP